MVNFFPSSENKKFDELKTLLTETNDLLRKLNDNLEQINNNIVSVKKDNQKSFPSPDNQNKEPLPDDQDISEVTIQPSTDKSQTPVPNLIIKKFLEEKNIQIKNWGQPEIIPDDLYNLSKKIGEYFTALNKFWKLLKQSANTGTMKRLPLEDADGETISHIVHTGNKLKELLFLSEFRYFKTNSYTTRHAVFSVNRSNPIGINFINGKWLEYYIIHLIRKTFGQLTSEEFGMMHQVQIRFPDNKDYELDIIFYLKDLFYWIEIKGGQINNNTISKYLNYSDRFFNIPRDRFILVTSNNNNKTNTLRQLYNLNILHFSELANFLQELNQ